MRSVPALKSKDVVRILKRLGFEEDRQKGSHLVLLNRNSQKRIVIPVHHGRDIKKTLLLKLIKKDLGMSVEDFLKLRQTWREKF